MTKAAITTRFAPSPTGFLHVGHVHAAWFAWRAARESGGRFLLRLEDIDRGRCRGEFADAIAEDLIWLGLNRDGDIRRQSDHFGEYRAALGRLDAKSLLYPCFCTRADIRREIEGAAHAPHGPDGPLYPGTCRSLSAAERKIRKEQGEEFAIRLDLARAIATIGEPLYWTDREAGRQTATPEVFGDVVLARKDVPTSYHLSVVLDDALQGVSLVTRGTDLFPASHIQRLLQALLEIETPTYHHHPLIMGPDGRRLAKRDQSLTVRSLREAERSPADVFALAQCEGLLPDF